MTALSWLMFIMNFISTFQWPNSIAQHTNILYNNSEWSSTKYDPEGTNWDNQYNRTTTMNESYTEAESFRNNSVTGMENITVNIVLPTANLTNSSSIDFQTSTDKKIKINKFIPEQNAIEKCSLNETFCIKVDNYPREYLSNFFGTSKFMSASYYDIDAMNEVNDFETRIISDTQFQSFCQSRTEVIYPEAGLTSKNEWRYIVQAPEEMNDNGTFIKQGVLVEKCIDIRVPCQFDDTLPLGYVSTCVQKYIYKRLISIEGEYQFHYDTFKMPSCCQCMYYSKHEELQEKSEFMKIEDFFINYLKSQKETKVFYESN